MDKSVTVDEYRKKIDSFMKQYSSSLDKIYLIIDKDENKFKALVLALFEGYLINDIQIPVEFSDDIYSYFLKRFKNRSQTVIIKPKKPVLRVNCLNIYEKGYYWDDFDGEFRGYDITEKQNLDYMISKLSLVMRCLLINEKLVYVYKKDNLFRLSFDKRAPYIFFRKQVASGMKRQSTDIKFERFFDDFLYNDDRITRKYFIFNPDKEPESSDTFNLWRGHKAKKLENYDLNAIQFIFDYLRIICGSRESVNWVLSWLSSVVRNPGKKLGKSLILFCNNGPSHTIIGKLMCDYVIGGYHSYTTCRLGTLVEELSTYREPKTFIAIGDIRIENSNATKILNELKELTVARIEFKRISGVGYYDIKNYTNIYVSAIVDDNFKYAEDHDKRYYMPDIVPKSQSPDCDYYSGIFRKLNDNVGDHFYTFLLNYPGIDVTDDTKLPKSHIKKIPHMSCHISDTITTDEIPKNDGQTGESDVTYNIENKDDDTDTDDDDRSVNGLVYIITEEDPEDIAELKSKKSKNTDIIRCKIGFTSRGINKRLNSLQAGNWRQLKCIGSAVTDDYVGMENQIHKECKSKRIRREWFRLDRTDLLQLKDRYNFKLSLP